MSGGREQGAKVQLVVFRVGSEQFGLPIGQVREVVRHSPPRSIGSQVPWIRGVMSLRGLVLPVIDLATRLGLDEAGMPTRLLIATPDEGRRFVAFATGDVDEIASLDPGAIVPAPPGHDEAVTGVAHLEERIVVMLDAAPLCEPAGEIDAMAESTTVGATEGATS